MSNPHIVYHPAPDATPEDEARALAEVYRFLLDCHAQKNGGVPSTADDAKEIKDDRADKASIP